MINHYTANKKVRNDEVLTATIGRRNLARATDAATWLLIRGARMAYERARESYRSPVMSPAESRLPCVAWPTMTIGPDKVRRSILLDSKADLVAFGMGENSIIEIARRLEAGETVKDLRDMRGVAYALGASEPIPNDALDSRPTNRWCDKLAFSEATRMIHHETNPLNARRLVQRHANQAVVCNPPQLPISEGPWIVFTVCPTTRAPHPNYREPIPAFQ